MKHSTENIKNFRHKRKDILIYVMGGKCQRCGYNKCTAALELHHCNPEEKSFGLSKTNRSLESVFNEARKCILLCSNCHREVEFWNITTTPSFDEIKAKEIIQQREEEKNKTAQQRICPICGNKKEATATFCKKCAKRMRVSKLIPREDLKKLIRTTSFLQIGKQFNVSDNAVRKWCIKYNLPSKRKDIDAISDKEWLDI